MVKAVSAKPLQEGASKRGFVKQVLSGDAVVVVLLLSAGAPGNPPNELTVYLANVAAPRLALRPIDNSTPATNDEPYAWEAREFIRKKIVGQNVLFVCEFIAASGREHGRIYLGGTRVENAENISETAVAAGFLEVRPGKQTDEPVKKLLELQQEAKAAKKGKWSDDESSKHIRNIQWNIEDPRQLVAKHDGERIDAVVEQVCDGSTIRAFLLPNFEYVTIALSGVKTPGVRVGSEGKPEEFGEEAKYFVEIRLLQRDVKVVLEGAANQNIIGSVFHPAGNIAEFLLREGLAKCMDWSMELVKNGAEKLRDAERCAKESHLKLWKVLTGQTTAAVKNGFSAKVVEVGWVDSLFILKDDGEELKIYFSSLKPPRCDGVMYEARGFLRKGLIDKRVNVVMDYIQPKQDQFPEKTCCTVLFNNQNVAVMLIERGFAKTIRHHQNDDNRSSQYDQLIAAETKAETEKKGMWAEMNAEQSHTLHVQELQGDAQRSKQFLPYHQPPNPKIYTEKEFLAAAKNYFNDGDYLQCSEKLWGAASYCVKKVLYRIGVGTNSHTALRCFVTYYRKKILEQNNMKKESKKLLNQWGIAQRCHNFFYDPETKNDKEGIRDAFNEHIKDVEKFCNFLLKAKFTEKNFRDNFSDYFSGLVLEPISGQWVTHGDEKHYVTKWIRYPLFDE